jgi:hypothetical protein
MPDDNQDRLRAAIAERLATEQAREAAAQQCALDEQGQRERLRQLQAQAQQVAILINNRAIAQSQAVRSAGGSDRFHFSSDEPGQSSVAAWRVRVVIDNGKPRGPFGHPELRFSLERSGALIATWPGTLVQVIGPTHRKEEIILAQDDPARPLERQIENLLIPLYERVVKADAAA